MPRALETHEVKDLVQVWGNAARRAQEAGFNVLELHGAHGYLVHEFLSERSNQRTDEYGGSESNRMRFLIEVAYAVRTYWPERKPLFVRLSVEDNAGWGPERSAKIAKILHGDQAEQILRDGQADLIAVGREILNNPNWPMDAALKLGVEGSFRHVPHGWWLGTRAKRSFGIQPSTWQKGLGHE